MDLLRCRAENVGVRKVEMKSIKKLIPVAAMLCIGFAAGHAQATPVFSDIFVNSIQGIFSDGGALTNVTVSAPVHISNIGVNNATTATTQFRFLILQSPGPGTTPTVKDIDITSTFGSDGSFSNFTEKVSDPFSFTLLPGITYYIGAIVDGSANYTGATTSFTQGVFTSSGPNENFSGFALVMPNFGGGACCRIPLELLDGAAVVPEPATFALVGVALFGLGVARRKLK